MPRFTKQHDRFSCGPTAIVNALKWAGEKLSYRDCKQQLCKTVDCINPQGTSPSKLDKALRKLGKKYLQIEPPTKLSIPNLRKHLSSDSNAAVLRFIWPDFDAGHYVFIRSYNPCLFGGMYHVFNLYNAGPAARWVLQADFKKIVSKRTSTVCWLLTKKD